MKKPKPNTPCPCGSGRKYKKCCQPYHRGAKPDNALTLMKSRYAAYALGQSVHHPHHPPGSSRLERGYRLLAAIDPGAFKRIRAWN